MVLSPVPRTLRDRARRFRAFGRRLSRVSSPVPRMPMPRASHPVPRTVRVSCPQAGFRTPRDRTSRPRLPRLWEPAVPRIRGLRVSPPAGTAAVRLQALRAMYKTVTAAAPREAVTITAPRVRQAVTTTVPRAREAVTVTVREASREAETITARADTRGAVTIIVRADTREAETITAPRAREAVTITVKADIREAGTIIVRADIREAETIIVPREAETITARADTREAGIITARAGTRGAGTAIAREVSRATGTAIAREDSREIVPRDREDVLREAVRDRRMVPSPLTPQSPPSRRATGPIKITIKTTNMIKRT